MSEGFESAERVRDEQGRQYHIGLAPDEVARAIMLVGDPARATRVAGLFDHVELERRNREYVTCTGTHGGLRMTVMGTGMGTGPTEIAVIKLCQLVERPLMLRCGSAGALQPDIQLGDLVISQGALRLENTTRFFVDEGYPAVADPQAVLALAAAADAAGHRWHVGITATAPGFYGAQGRKIVLFKWVGIFTDIHEQKMASEILEQKVDQRTQQLKESNRRLEDSNNELQQFAFVASHDLQEPLRKIQVFSAMVREGSTSDKPENKTYLNKIAASAERMRKMITDLLDFARPPEHDFFKTAKLNDIVDEVLSDLEVKIKTLNARIDVDKLAEFDVVPGQIKQLFQNLILNSLKFSKKDVAPLIKITGEFIQEKTFTATAKKSGPYYRVTVQDNGIGFDEIYAERIFEIFQRLNQKDAYEGFGIGLSIVKKIIDRHNGQIHATSKRGEGASFTIILPVTHS